MKLALSDIPAKYRPTIVLLVGSASLLFAATQVEAKLDNTVTNKVSISVEKKWNEHYQKAALEACTTAADNGAYRAVTEAMQQTVLPLQRRLETHMAVQEEHEKNTQDRFRRIEKKIGLD